MPASDGTLPQNLVGPGSSPKLLYVFFLLKLCTTYFDTMRDGSDHPMNVDSATAALIAFCPDKVTREKIWGVYTSKKDSEGQITASVMAVGELISYLSESLEFTETVTAGFL
jgi:hypothetical protein